MKKVGVGIIGGNATRGWACRAHFPALAAHPDAFSLKALSTTRYDSAREAATHFGVPRFYTNARDLAADPEVDLVVVSVKVPDHFDAVMAAISAGKNVFCEWPLGRNLDEANALHQAAENAGIYTAVGLQARLSPDVQLLRASIQNGLIGNVLSTSVIASGISWGENASPGEYLSDRRNGATLLSIPFGHFVDAMVRVLGPIASVSAVLGLSGVRRHGGGPSASHNQLAVAGEFESGAVFSAHVRGGMSRHTNFHWELNGDAADLLVTASHGHIQQNKLSILFADAHGISRSLVPPAGDDPAAGVQFNVSLLYGQIASDIAKGTNLAPDFGEAVRLHRLLESIERSADAGRRMDLIEKI